MRQALTAEQSARTQEQKDATKEMPSWYLFFTVPFYAGVLIAVGVLCAGVVLPHRAADDAKTRPVAEPLRFAITQSAVHPTKNGREAHTFLLNQQTGELWQMICDRQGKFTAWQRVPRLDLKGNPEKDESGKKP
jgi:hypothetical protein